MGRFRDADPRQLRPLSPCHRAARTSTRLMSVMRNRRVPTEAVRSVRCVFSGTNGEQSPAPRGELHVGHFPPFLLLSY
ncbi:hypothetical protein EYF80_004772 [Liparis tanakae]|uniref:Uncharacterized protein n=1 Tax=Liparis tanakae TaxID=230148 RepID=A0A4Z2J631_9TELE|nr:hypothetical protein EYF80_004772 [Liparis tanakae]